MFEKVFELQDLIDKANDAQDPQLAKKAKEAINGARMLDEITPNEEVELLMELKVDYTDVEEDVVEPNFDIDENFELNEDFDDILDDLI